MALTDCVVVDNANQFVAAPHANYIKAMFTDAVHSYEQSEASTDAYQFRSQGRVWVLTFDGVTSLIPERDASGLAYIHQVVKQPHTQIHVKLLMAAMTGAPTPAAAGIIEAMLDRPAMLDVRRKFDSLKAELDDAEEFSHDERAASVRDEIGKLAAEVGLTKGLGGRPRSFDDDGEKLRKQVSMAVSRAIDVVNDEDAKLGRHLSTFVKTGYSISYTPDTCPPWVT